MFAMSQSSKQKVVVVGAGPVGALAALYAAGRGDHVEVYELRDGQYILAFSPFHPRLLRQTLSSLCVSSCCLEEGGGLWILLPCFFIFHFRLMSYRIDITRKLQGVLPFTLTTQIRYLSFPYVATDSGNTQTFGTPPRRP